MARMRHMPPPRMAGSALLEVAIAMLLLAGATVAVLGAQLAMHRVAVDSAARMTALRLADSWAELARIDATRVIDTANGAAPVPAALSDLRIEARTQSGYARVDVRWGNRAAAACEVGASSCVTLAYSPEVAR